MTNANANDGKTSPVLPTLEQVYALLKANPHDLLIGMGKSGGMSIHGTWQDPVCKTWRNTGNHMYPSIPTGWAMDSVLVLTWSLFADIRTEVSKMAGCAGELE